MTAQGLARYNNELERLIVKLRFLALGGFYRDFCYVAWGESSYPMYSLWADEMQISQLRVGQLVGLEFHANSEADNSELFASALRQLIRCARTEVLQALLRAHGGESGLLVSLWNSTKTHDREDCEFGEVPKNFSRTGDNFLCTVATRCRFFSLIERFCRHLRHRGPWSLVASSSGAATQKEY